MPFTNSRNQTYKYTGLAVQHVSSKVWHSQMENTHVTACGLHFADPATARKWAEVPTNDRYCLTKACQGSK